MKKTILFLLLTLGGFSSSVFAQAFTEIPIGLGNANGDGEWGDYDGDGDLDLAIVGGNIGSALFQLWRNNGDGTFTEISTGIDNISNARLDWGDYDNNGTLDIAITGVNYGRIYKNTGGTFTDISAGLAALNDGSVEWGDYDNDNDLDLLMNGDGTTTIYRNDGSDTFTAISAGIDGVSNGEARWGDYDNDNDLDVVVVGSNIAKIYRNDGSDTFTDISAGLTGVFSATVGWGDYDGDNDLDVLVVGGDAFFYRNDGSDTFTPLSSVSDSLQGTSYGEVHWSDFDSDGDLDIGLVGGGSSRFYKNDSGTFTEFANGLPGISFGFMDWGDYDGNGDLDILIGGFNLDVTNVITYVYANIIFKEDTSSTFTAVTGGDMDFGDFDNDGDLDLIVAGNENEGTVLAHTNIYQNDGSGGLTSITHAIPAASFPSLDWGDYDNDGDLDLAISGNDGAFGTGTDFSAIYRNDSGTFTDISAGLIAMDGGSLDWGDYDRDGDLDILMTGFSGDSSDSYSLVYRNNGNDSFTDISAGLQKVMRGRASWGDYDGDGDLDILLNGNENSVDGTNTRSRIYRNDGNDTFTDISAGIIALGSATSVWGDYDSDGDLDILVSGAIASDTYTTRIYRNDGNDTFTDINAGLTSMFRVAADWGDFDNDGDLDLLVHGNTNTGTSGTFKLYQNIGSDTFIDVTHGLPAIVAVTSVTSIKWGDYDGDGDLDFFTMGGLLTTPEVALYENPLNIANTAPAAPTGLSHTVTTDSVSFSWSAATDSETSQNGLTYNLRIGTTSGGDEILSAMADAGTGFRRVVEYGNMEHNTSFVLDSTLGTGTYHWSVQAVDNGYKGSAFSSEGVFAVDGFTELAAGFTGADEGTTDFIDYDGDGDLDAVVSGFNGSVYSTKIYDNDGNGNFTDNSKGLPAGISGMVAWSDYDNDGDLDAAVTGYLTGGEYTRIYQNTGGVFTDIAAGLDSLNHGFLAWGDYDNDGDDDLFLSGNNGTNRVTDIYENDNGTFTAISAGLTAVDWSYAAWGDYDNDGDLDLVVQGHFDASNRTTNIYQNTNGTFSDISAGIPGLAAGSFDWGDYDGDGDLDLVLSGTSVGGRNALIYQNNGGSFSDISAGLTGIERGSTEWGDYDNDGDLDLLLTGDQNGTYYTILYENNSGTFSNTNAGFTAMYTGRGVFGDIDNDGDLDILVSGYDGTNYHAKMYENHRATSNTAPNVPSGLVASNSGTTATFSWSKSTDSETTQNSLTYNVRIGTTPGGSDILSGMADTGTGFRRVATTGNSGHANSLTINNLSIGTTYYWSVQTIDNAFEGSAFATEGTFAVEGLVDASAGFIGLSSGSLDWGDYDNDGDLDLLITGSNTTILYKNTAGSFSSVGTGLPGMVNSDAAWGDYDGDGDLDLAMVGRNSTSGIISKIFRNDGGDTFTDISTGLTGVRYSSVDWGDFDNDGDLDLLLAGYDGSSVHAKVYQNNSGTFSDISAGFTGVRNAYVKWVDIDNDNDLDAVVFGYLGDFTQTSTVYRNDGGSFTAITSNLPVAGDVKPVFADFDNDGDMDIAFAHTSNSGVYANNGSGSFTEVWSATDLTYGVADAGDFDNDGDLDILMAGWIQLPSSQRVARIYRNDGSNTFTDIAAGLNGVQQGAAAWGDYDGDNDLDLVIQGTNGSTSSTTLYQNYESTANTAPGAPSNLMLSIDADSLTFSWDPSSNADAGVSYNLFIATNDTNYSQFNMLAESDTSNGYRLIPAMGNVGSDTSYTLVDIPSGEFYWGVQAIDNGFMASDFVSSSSFNFGGLPYTVSGDEGWRMLSTPFTNATYGSLLEPFWTQGFTGADTENGTSNVYTWDESNQQFSSLANAATVPAAGTGLIAYIYNDQDFDGSADGFPKSAFIEGSGSSGTVDPTISYTDTGNPNDDGWNLMGNPYNRAIDWDASSGWTKTNLNATVYIWSDSASSGAGDYLEWNGSTGSLGDGLIAPFQGFWLQANTSSPDLQMTEAVQHNSEGVLYKQAPGTGKGDVHQIQFSLAGDGKHSRAFVMLHEEAGLNKDALDSYKLQSLNAEYLSLYTVLESGTPLGINAIPSNLEETTSYGLDLDGSNLNGTFHLAWNAASFPKDWKVELTDHVTGETMDVTGTSNYEFEMFTQAKVIPSTGKNSLVLSHGIIAPAVVQSRAKGTEGTRFSLIIKPGTAVSTETEELPSVVALLQNYPNPFNPSTTINFDLPAQGHVRMDVFNIMGRRVATLIDKPMHAGYHQVRFNASHLASGMYIYRLAAGNTVITKKLTLIK